LCAAPEQSAAQNARLHEKIELCKTCHGADGNSTIEKTPSLAGQPEFFLLNQLVLIREGVRPVREMAEAARDLTDDDIQALAAYYSRLPAKPAGPKPDPALAAKAKPLAEKLLCGSCHGKGLEGIDQIPRLAKQRVDYLIYAMRAYKTDARPGADTTMAAAIASASDSDLIALAHYAASF
ncbi:MAG: cytochrome c, partial [Beijerinckiaceae bacterium]